VEKVEGENVEREEEKGVAETSSLCGDSRCSMENGPLKN
jgi:hypothetical protein